MMVKATGNTRTILRRARRLDRISYNASVDSCPFPVSELKLVARKDPEGENAAWNVCPDTSASPMIPIVKSEAPFGYKSRMTEVSYVRAMQAVSAPPAKNRERIGPRRGLKEWMHACSFIFHTLISPLYPHDAKRLESVREKDIAMLLRLWLPVRTVSACFGVRVGLSL
jgi:hypothetical protein